MRRLNAPPKELRIMFNREWKRAKKLCKPFLDTMKRPRLYTAKVLRHGWLGYHSGRNGQTLHKINGRWLSGDIIVIRESHLTSPDLLGTVRHEICHTKHHNHKIGFQTMLRGLNKEDPSPEKS